ncbi:hypothetical protein IV38_GL000139 [Lactobacillus selangorensis]|uniref:ABC3 transporter permease C-terminal domain-containing protein n=1 Tax=Lactobacillus selangorensis TaxID=81857 RepID=A0A0R2FMG6_9LACO|nr:FtsX-like permease family protein [Lactobacillus selangorensis]KRN29257.1 hypothetical protein IV38_GL000139 [Lactobacillus selangorensis]KRN29785.1 hypothetical protein IV40_GL000586 [Lactobacillus selangorensis]
MRFLERAVASLLYHRKFALGIVLWSFLFLSGTLYLSTMIVLERQSLNQLDSRFYQLPTQTHQHAVQLLGPMQKVHRQLIQHYEFGLLLFIGICALVFLLFIAIYLRSRRKEFRIYRFAGKSNAFIGRQFMGETLLTFVLAFIFFFLLTLLFSKSLLSMFQNLNQQAFMQALNQINISRTNFNRLLREIFQARLTPFNGNTLLFGPGQDPDQFFQFPSLLATYGGLGGLFIAAASWCSAWLASRIWQHSIQKRG